MLLFLLFCFGCGCSFNLLIFHVALCMYLEKKGNERNWTDERLGTSSSLYSLSQFHIYNFPLFWINWAAIPEIEFSIWIMGGFDDLHNQLYKNIGNKWKWVFQNRESYINCFEKFIDFAFLIICFCSEGWKLYLNYRVCEFLTCNINHRFT